MVNFQAGKSSARVKEYKLFVIQRSLTLSKISVLLYNGSLSFSNRSMIFNKTFNHSTLTQL